jgi:hypothetical protein
MRHKVEPALTGDEGWLIGQPVCRCGWKGDLWDIGEPSERKRFDQQALAHRLTVSVSRGLSCFMWATALLWFSAIAVGVVYLVRLLAGW